MGDPTEGRGLPRHAPLFEGLHASGDTYLPFKLPAARTDQVEAGVIDRGGGCFFRWRCPNFIRDTSYQEWAGLVEVRVGGVGLEAPVETLPPLIYATDLDIFRFHCDNHSGKMCPHFARM